MTNDHINCFCEDCKTVNSVDTMGNAPKIGDTIVFPRKTNFVNPKGDKEFTVGQGVIKSITPSTIYFTNGYTTANDPTKYRMSDLSLLGQTKAIFTESPITQKAQDVAKAVGELPGDIKTGLLASFGVLKWVLIGVVVLAVAVAVVMIAREVKIARS